MNHIYITWYCTMCRFKDPNKHGGFHGFDCKAEDTIQSVLNSIRSVHARMEPNCPVTKMERGPSPYAADLTTISFNLMLRPVQ